MIDPRSFPLKEVLCFVKRNSPNSRDNSRTSIGDVLDELISKHCPDVIYYVNNLRLLDYDNSAINSLDITPSTLCEGIRDCLGGGTSDPSGIRAEQMYHLANSCIPIDVLVATVCSAVLTPTHSQPKCFNYVHLCKDPPGETYLRQIIHVILLLFHH